MPWPRKCIAHPRSTTKDTEAGRIANGEVQGFPAPGTSWGICWRIVGTDQGPLTEGRAYTWTGCMTYLGEGCFVQVSVF